MGMDLGGKELHEAFCIYLEQVGGVFFLSWDWSEDGATLSLDPSVNSLGPKLC
jgi:hypothetical protein